MLKNSSKNSLFNFAYFPNYDSNIKYLAEELAETEPWDFTDVKIKCFAILKNYLDFTFRKLFLEKKIAYTPNNKYACFNSGLVTNNAEDIFVFFEKYKSKGTYSGSPYYFLNFLKKSDNVLLKHFSENLPDTANYFDKPELLFFNPKFELIPDIDHIINDNISRFPTHLQTADAAELRRQIIGSIEEIKKRVRNNYKIAVPQYFDNKIQLLIPLCLSSGSPNPDLALVVHQINNNTYTARTCLSLKMAYNNARLIVKPESNWLKP